MKVKCINNHNWEESLTINKIYDVLSKDNFGCKIKDDLGITCNLSKERFEIIEEKESGI